MGRQAGGLLQEMLRLPAARLVAVADVHLGRAQAVTAKHGGQAFRTTAGCSNSRRLTPSSRPHPSNGAGRSASIPARRARTCTPRSDVAHIREGRLIVQAARKYNRVFQVGSQQRSMGRNRIGCEFIRTGKLGKIKRVIAHNYPTPWEGKLPAQPVPAELNWDMWCGPAPVVLTTRTCICPGPIRLALVPAILGRRDDGWGPTDSTKCNGRWAWTRAAHRDLVEGPKFDPPTYTLAEPKARGDKICSEPKVFFATPATS